MSDLIEYCWNAKNERMLRPDGKEYTNREECVRDKGVYTTKTELDKAILAKKTADLEYQKSVSAAKYEQERAARDAASSAAFQQKFTSLLSGGNETESAIPPSSLKRERTSSSGVSWLTILVALVVLFGIAFGLFYFFKYRNSKSFD